MTKVMFWYQQEVGQLRFKDNYFTFMDVCSYIYGLVY